MKHIKFAIEESSIKKKESSSNSCSKLLTRTFPSKKKILTRTLEVALSKPVPAEAKQTPDAKSVILYCGSKYAGTNGRRPKASEMKSGGIRPLENLPVGRPPKKSRPYGWKLLLSTVDIWLLLPASTEESPKTITAGILAAAPPPKIINSEKSRHARAKGEAIYIFLVGACELVKGFYRRVMI